MGRESLCSLSNGDQVYREHEAVVLAFHGKRKVLSTGGPNGGYSDHLTHIVNYKSGFGYCSCPENAPCTFEEYLQDYVEGTLGLSLKSVSTMGTIVSMGSVCIESQSYRDLTVTAIATASLEVNGGRPGDPAEYEEQADPTKPGTINIMLHVNTDLSPACMARAIVTLTESKTAAIQELLGSSLYSSGIATGSGSDTVMIVADAESPAVLRYAGKHSKLGELIGLTVMKAVKRSLGKHMNLTPASQHSMSMRTFRYGLTALAYWEEYQKRGGTKTWDAFRYPLDRADTRDNMVTLTSLYVHLMDQVCWGLLDQKEASDAGEGILDQMARICGIEREPCGEIAIRGNSKNACKYFDLPPEVKPMVSRFASLMVQIGSGE